MIQHFWVRGYGIFGNNRDVPIDIEKMPRLPKVKHYLTIGSDKYSFNAPDIYGDFGAALGVTKAQNPDNTVSKGRLTADDYAAGKALKLKCRGVQKDSNGKILKSREFTFVVSFDKARSAISTIGQKKAKANGIEYDLNDPRIPRRQRLG